MSQPRAYRYYDFIMAAFVTVLLCSNLIGAAKVCSIHIPWLNKNFVFGAGILFFPLSYIFGDILTEVYGYARSRKVVWAGVGALIFSALMSSMVLGLPPAASWENQSALETAFGNAPRVILASIIAYFCGEFTNSFVLAKLKIYSAGKKLWMRTIGSTIAGEGVDSLIFYPLAFLKVWPTSLVLQVMVSNYVMKVLVEVFMTPVTYRVVNYLKRAENEDYYDRQTNFTPFSVKL